MTVAASAPTNAGGIDGLAMPHFTWTQLKARVFDINQYDALIEIPNVWQPQMSADFYTASKLTTAKQRWFPPSIAMAEITAYKARTTQYTGTDYPAYDTKRKAWDDAITAGAKKADFFATLFNPPKKTAPPERPNQPTRPEDYTGMYQQPFTGWTKASYTFTKSRDTTTSATQKLTGNQFLVDGMRGGYGAFTSGLLKTTENMEKSFGVYGWGKTTTTPVYKAQEMSFVQDWTDMCLALVSSVQNGFCPTDSAAAAVAATTVEQIIAVSMWANDKSAPVPASSNTGMKVSFDINKWAQNATAWAKPARPAAGTAPKK